MPEMPKEREELLSELRTALEGANTDPRTVDYMLQKENTDKLSDEELRDQIDRYQHLAERTADAANKVADFSRRTDEIAERIHADFEANVKKDMEEIIAARKKRGGDEQNKGNK